MGMWLKIFCDGSIERGTDGDIRLGKASWSRGQLDDIQEVRVMDSLVACSLTVPQTSWHHFDRFEVMLNKGVNKPIRTHRVIQAEVNQHHVGQYLVCSRTGQYFVWAIIGDLTSIKNPFFTKEVTSSHIGRWITMILPKIGHPEIGFSAKGKIHDNECISK